MLTPGVSPQGTAQVSLADCEGSGEMVYHWLRVQMLSGAEFQKNPSHRRHHDNHDDEPRPRMTVNARPGEARWCGRRRERLRVCSC